MERTRTLPALDGLRGLAALLVVLAHASNHDLGPSLFEGAGRHGVFLFFVLSSFLLTRQLLDEEAAPRGPADWVAWAGRRLLRVLPAYGVAVAAYGLLDHWTRERVVGHLTLSESWFHLWTIPVEVQAYAVLPAVAAVHGLLGRRRARTAAALGVALVAARLLAPPDYASGFPPFLFVFLSGALLACVPEGSRARLAGAGWPGLLLLLALLPGLHAALGGGPVERLRFHLWFEALTLGSLGLLAAAAGGQGPLARVLAHPALRAVGRISYSLYLLHMLVLSRVLVHMTGAGEPLAWLAYLGMSLSLAFAGERLVERPFRALGR